MFHCVIVSLDVTSQFRTISANIETVKAVYCLWSILTESQTPFCSNPNSRRVYIGHDTVVVSSPDSQSGGTGFDSWWCSTCSGLTKPAFLSGRRVGTSFDWVNGSAPLSRSPLVELWHVINACHFNHLPFFLEDVDAIPVPIPTSTSPSTPTYQVSDLTPTTAPPTGKLLRANTLIPTGKLISNSFAAHYATHQFAAFPLTTALDFAACQQLSATHLQLHCLPLSHLGIDK